MKEKNFLYESEKFTDLRDMVEKTTKKFGDGVAFVEKKVTDGKVSYRDITFNETKEDINALGTALISLGLKDKKIAIIAPDRYEWGITYLAVVNGVGVIVPLDRSLLKNEISNLLKRSESDAIFFDKKYADTIKEIKEENKDLKVQYYINLDAEEDNEFLSYKKLLENGRKLLKESSEYAQIYANADIDPNEMRILLYTSGTTSLSKAVMLTHGNITSELYALIAVLDSDPKDTYLLFLPLHHALGAISLLFLYIKGTKTVFCDGLRHIQENMKEYNVTVLVTVPLLADNLYKKIMKQVEKQGKTKKVMFARKLGSFLMKFGIDIRRKLFKEIIDNLGGLRIIVCGAAALDKEVSKALNEMGITVVQGYGLTETSPVICVEPDQYIRYGSVGFPVKDVEVEIDNPNEKGIGEIKARGPVVMKGYYQDEEATKETIKDGWIYTGDLGYKDKDGYFYITGRKKYVIVLKNGKNIYPEELEQLISKLPYVDECMVFGFPKDDDLIVSVKIVYNKEYIENNYKDITKEELEKIIWEDIKKINTDLPGYKHMKKLIISDEPMVKTTTQKIKRFIEIEKIIKELENKD